MDHTLSESQQLLQRSAAGFFAQQYPLDRLRELHLDRDRRDPELWQALSGLGWTAAPFAEEIGGFPGSLFESAPLLVEMGRAAYPSPYLHSCIAAGLALVAAGKTDVASAIADGTATVAWAPRTGIVPPVSLSGDTVSGTSIGVSFPMLATHVLVQADSGIALVSATSDGVTRRNLDSAGAETLGEVQFANARAEAVLPSSASEDVVLAGAAGAALMLLGASERALELAVEYAKMRNQFGQPIGAFQSLQHKMADMVIDNEVAKNLAYRAAYAHGSDDFPRAAQFAKSYLGDAARRVTRQAIQIHGGVGFIDNHKVQLPYRLALNLIGAYRAPHEHRVAITDRILAATA